MTGPPERRLFMSGPTNSQTISNETKTAIKELCTHYPEKRAALIPSLLLVQKELGALPDDVQLQIAEILELPPPQVREVVSFYPMLRTKPVGKCHIEVCRTLSCAMRGSRTLMKKLEDELHVHQGETTKDGLFTVSSIECLAGCGSAPSMLVNGEYVENVDWPKMEAILNRVRKGDKPV
jgi:NADH-quinone oxidoreductase subunit E